MGGVVYGCFQYCMADFSLDDLPVHVITFAKWHKFILFKLFLRKWHTSFDHFKFISIKFILIVVESLPCSNGASFQLVTVCKICDHRKFIFMVKLQLCGYCKIIPYVPFIECYSLLSSSRFLHQQGQAAPQCWIFLSHVGNYSLQTDAV